MVCQFTITQCCKHGSVQFSQSQMFLSQTFQSQMFQSQTFESQTFQSQPLFTDVFRLDQLRLREILQTKSPHTFSLRRTYVRNVFKGFSKVAQGLTFLGQLIYDLIFLGQFVECEVSWVRLFQVMLLFERSPMRPLKSL